MGAEKESGRSIKVEESAALAPNFDLLGGGVQQFLYRTDAFFDDAKTFASQKAFFEQARQKLLQDCGYEARPSKQKPTRISARCEKYATQGCPFRLSARLDEGAVIWRLSAANCTWQHSHVPIPEVRVGGSAPAAAKCARDDDGNDSQEARTAVLYTGGERFPSSDTFVQETRQISLERYDVGCWSTHRTQESVQLGCANRKKSRCGYRVAARRDGRQFVVDLERCNWVHSHPRGSTNVVEPGTARLKSGGSQQKRKIDDVESEVDDEAENEDEDERGGEDEEVDEEGAESDDTAGASQVKIVPPTAPKVRDRFDTLGEAYLAFAVANVLHFGKSVTRSGARNLSAGVLYCYRRPSCGEYCPFRVVIGRTENDTHSAVLDSSILYHNHGPRPELLADPAWRPTLRCKLVLAALAKLDATGQKTIPNTSTSLGRPDLMPPPPVPKRARLSEPGESPPTGHAPYSPVPQQAPPTATPPVQGSKFSWSPRALDEVRTSTPTDTVNAGYSARHKQPATTLPTDSDSNNAPSFNPTPGPAPSSKIAPASSSGTKIATVSSFLAGLDVALVPLASHLIDAGIDSLESLTALACLSADATTGAGTARGLADDTITDLKALFADSLLKVKREQQDSSNNMHATAHGAVKTPAPTLVARRQPPSKQPTKPAPLRGGGSQRKNQEGEDSDAYSLSSASSSMAERATSTATMASDGTWNAITTSKAMRNLVLKREEIFAAQRQARDYRLQDISREAVETAFSQRTTSSAAYLSGFRNYVKFCSRVDVPPFPITHTMMALWLYEKCSNREGHFQTYKHGLGIAADTAKHLWTTIPVFHAMRQFDPDGIAIKEFWKEPQRRKNALAKASPKSAAKRASEQRGALHEPLVAFFDSAGNASKDKESKNTSEPDNGNRGPRLYAGGGEQVEDARPVAVRRLPTRNSAYESITEIYKAYVAAIVPVYGISVMPLNATQNNAHIRCNRYHAHYSSHPGGACPWVAFCRRRPDGKWIVNFDASTFEHSHGPCKEILADPAWRPVVRNTDARDALGMAPLPPQSRAKRQKLSDSTGDQPLQKKARLSKPPPIVKKPLPPPTVPTRPAVASPPQPLSWAATSRRSLSAQDPYPLPVSPSAPRNHPPRDAPAFNKPVFATAPSSESAPRIPSPLATRAPTSPAPPIQPSSQTPDAAVAEGVAAEAFNIDVDPIELVSAFCAGLHPSLVALAEPLVAAGVYSFDGLVALRVLGPHQFDQFLAQLRKIHSQRCAQSPSLPPLSNIHILLFAKHTKA